MSQNVTRLKVKYLLSILSLFLISCTLQPITEPRPSTPPLPQSAFMSPLGMVPPKTHRILLHPIYNYYPEKPEPPQPPPCFANPEAEAFAQLLVNDSRQRRPVMICDPRLVSAAQQRAESMARLGYIGHCDPLGVCPNQVIIANGCQLPSHYPPNGNNGESLVAGARDPQVAYDHLMQSNSHSKHLLALDEFYKGQDRYGVGYVYRPCVRYQYFWVILTAICE